MENNKVYFKDIYNKRPVHYDCIIGKIKLVWNDEVIDIFRDSNGPKPEYRPVVNGEYAEEMWGIFLSGDFFTKEDLDEYIKKVKNYKEEKEKRQQAMKKALIELKNIIDSKIDSSIKDKLSCMEYWYFISSDSYALGYDVKNNVYTINKFHPNQPIDKRFYYWNHDDEFKEVESDNKNEIIDKFIELISEEYRK